MYTVVHNNKTAVRIQIGMEIMIYFLKSFLYNASASAKIS